MTPEEIKKALEDAGHCQIDIARALSVAPASVHCVIFKGAVSARIRSAIANAIGKPVAAIWPDSKQAAATVEEKAA